MTRGFQELKKKICKARFWFVPIVALMIGGTAAADSVVIQGYQVQTERYAANTVDAFVNALQTLSDEVVALRPKSQPGWAGGESYTTKTELLNRLRIVAGESADLVVILVGDADGPDGSFRVGAEAGVSAAELADAVAGASGVTLVSSGCNAIAEEMAGRLSNVSIAVSGVSQGQSAHTWPKGDRGQYDLYSRALIGNYYLLATGPGATLPPSELIGRAHRAARHTTIKLTGGRQQPTRLTGQQGMFSGARGAVVGLGNREYGIHLQVGAASVSGYVANSLGLPIAPIQDAKRVDGVVLFSFKERGRSVEITVRDVDGLPNITIDGSSADFAYQTTRVELVSSSRILGAAYLASTLDGAPRVMVTLENRNEVTQVSFDAASQSVGLKIPDNGKMIQAKLTFAGLGDIQVMVGDTQYSASSALRYGLYGSDGNLEATIAGILSDGQLKGELLPATSDMRLPLTASLTKGGLTGSATLVGSTYTLSNGSEWVSTRPPAKGCLQSDYFHLPVVRNVYADATSGTGSVELTWEIDTAAMSSALLLGDLRFQVVRTDRFNNVAKAFDVPAGRRRYADRPEGDAKAFDYAVRPVLDHRVITCSEDKPVALVGVTVAAMPGTPAQVKPPQPIVAAVAPTPGIAVPAPVVAEATVVKKMTNEKQVAAEKRMERKSKEEEAKQKAEAEKKRAEEEKNAEMEKEKEEDGLARLREIREGDGLKGKVVYGILGVFILMAVAIAAGGGGPSDLEPN